MMRVVVVLFCFSFLSAWSLLAEPEKSDGGFYQEDERVAVVGDSITAWGQYVAIAHLFHQTRLPHRKITWFNNALSGDQALYAKLRAESEGDAFAHDILRNQPTAAMIMLGMNDARNATIWSQPETVRNERRAAAAEDYRSSIAELIGKLSANGVERFVLVVSSPYDETTQAKSEPLVGKNGFIREVTAPWLHEKAEAMDQAILIDLNTPMMAINQREQERAPTFSTADMGDRVHPLKVGHSVMAYFVIKGLGFDSQVAEVEIDAAGRKVVTAKNCEITDLAEADSGIRFDYAAQALPFPAARFHFGDLVPFDEELNQEILRIRGLAAPRYDLDIDGEAVGTYSAKELAQGINLATNPKTPQYQQAVRVSQLNAQSWLSGNSKRHLIGSLRLMRIRKLETVEEQLEFMRGRRVPARGAARERHEEFLRLLEEGGIEDAMAESIRKSVAFNERAYDAAKPVSRTFTLTESDGSN